MKYLAWCSIAAVFFGLGFLTRGSDKTETTTEAERNKRVIKRNDGSSSSQNENATPLNPLYTSKAKDLNLTNPQKADFLEVLTIVDAEERKHAFQAILSQLTPEMAPELVEAIRKGDARGVDHGGSWDQLFRRWGEIDAEGALRFIDESDTSEWNKFARPGARYSLLAGWGRSDPNAALEYIKNQERLGNANERTVFSSWANRDPDEALKYILSDPEKSYLSHFDTISKAFCRKGGIDALLSGYHQAINSNPDDQSFRNKAAGTVLERLRHAPMSQKSNWVVAEAKENELLGDALIEKAYRNHQQSYPQQSVEMIASLAAEGSSPAALQRCISIETQKDPQKVGDWLNERKGEPRFDQMRAGYALSLIQIDPSSAAVWAKTITEPGLRQKTLEGLEK